MLEFFAFVGFVLVWTVVVGGLAVFGSLKLLEWIEGRKK